MQPFTSRGSTIIKLGKKRWYMVNKGNNWKYGRRKKTITDYICSSFYIKLVHPATNLNWTIFLSCTSRKPTEISLNFCCIDTEPLTT